MTTSKSKMASCSVKEVQFGILSPDEIRCMSVTDEGIRFTETVENGRPKLGGLMDPRQGAIDQNSPCQTCAGNVTECPGHFGHINLAKPVFHIGFVAKIMKILKCVCFHCSKLLVSPNDPKVQKIVTDTKRQSGKRLTFIFDLCKKILICDEKSEHGGCGHDQPTLKRLGFTIMAEWKTKELSQATSIPFRAEGILDILKKISDEEILILGMDPKYARPEWMIITVLPVPPLSVRPVIESIDKSFKKQDDLTKILAEIITINNKLIQSEQEGESPDKVLENFQMLEFRVAALTDNNNPEFPPTLKKSRAILKSIKMRLKGQKGRIRSNLMSKRVNFSARTVVTPDPNLEIDQVGVPKSIAQSLTFPELVTPFNIEKLQELVKNGDSKYPGAKYIVKNSGEMVDLRVSVNKEDLKLECGYKVERHLRDDDLVILSKQPSDYKTKMMGHRVKVLPWSTFRLNVSCFAPYDVDIGGNKMTLHVPQSLQTRAEVENIHMVSRQIISALDSQPTMDIGDDLRLAARKMTRRDVFIEKEEMMNLVMFLSNWDGKLPQPCILKPKPLWSGKQLFSLIIPGDLNIFRTNSRDTLCKFISPTDTTVLIENGQLIMGILNTGILGLCPGSLYHICMIDLGHKVCAEFYKNIQAVLNNWLSSEGFSFSIGDTIVDSETYLDIQKAIRESKVDVIEFIRKAHNNELEDPRREIFDDDADDILVDVEDKIEDIIRESVTEKNNLMAMVSSGSMPLSTAARIIGCVGPQNVELRRIPFGFLRRTLPHFMKDDYGPESRGFVENSYLAGLTPSEFYFHAMQDRDITLDHVLKAKEVRRIQRRLIKAMESVMVHYDGTVRNSAGQLIQVLYGEDGLRGEVLEYGNLSTINLNNKDFETKFKFDLARVENRSIFNEHVAQEVMNSEIVSEFENEWEQLKQDREMLRRIFPDEEVELHTLGLQRMLQDALKIFRIDKRKPTDLNPLTVIQGVKELLEKCVIVTGDDRVSKEVNKNATLLFQCLVRFTLCVKNVVEDLRLSSTAFECLIGEIENGFQEAQVPPGEMVGVLAAQSLGEIVSNMTRAPVNCSSISLKNSGISRLEEIINISKKPKAPSMQVFLKEEVAKDEGKARRVLCRLKHTTLRDLCANTAIYYDPDPLNTVIPEDREYVSSELPDFNLRRLSRWLLRVELDRKKKTEKNLTMFKIAEAIEAAFGEDVQCKFTDDEAMKLILRFRRVSNEDDIGDECGSFHQDNEGPDEKDYVFLRRFENLLLNNVAIQGVEGIKKGDLMELENAKKIVKETGAIEPITGWLLETEGSNLKKVLNDRDVDAKKTISNDINEIYNVLGIEAARKAMEKEIKLLLDFNEECVNYRHLALLCDVMTAEGHLTPIARLGIDGQDLGALMRCTVEEETIDTLFDAAFYAETDPLKGVSEKIIMGQLPRIGTGCFDVLTMPKSC